jgi:hypothetical protein
MKWQQLAQKQMVAELIQKQKIGTLLFDLLTSGGRQRLRKSI